MRPSVDLFRLDGAACMRLARLRKLAAGAAGGATGREREVVASYVALECLNCWVNFVRAYYLSCVLCPRLSGGVRMQVTAQFQTMNFNQALGYAIRRWRPRARPVHGVWRQLDEPAWHRTSTLLDLCTDMGCSNLPGIQAAVSTQARVFVDLPVFRNFYAHRNRETCRAAMLIGPQYGIPATRRPTEIMLSIPLNRPQVLLLDWIDELTRVIQDLCQ